MFDHRISFFLFLAWLLIKSTAPALLEGPQAPEDPVISATGVQPIEVEPETAR